MADWYFRNNQSGLQPCPACRNLVRTSEEFCPYCAKRLRAEGGFRGLLRKMKSYPFAATQVLLAMIVLVFILQLVADLFLPEQFRNNRGGGLFGMGTSYGLTYIRMGSNFHPFVQRYDEFWRFVTYNFLHFGILHIAFNGYALWTLGRLAEQLWGARSVFATFILTGICGGGASYLWNIWGGGVNSAGASGAICGLLGLLLGAYYRNRYTVGEFLGSQLVRWAVTILAYGLLMGADNAAHIGGIVSGAALGYFLLPPRHTKTPGRDAKIWTTMTVVSALLLVVCIGFAINFYAQGPMYAGLKLMASPK